MSVSNKIKELRISSGMTQEELAERLGLKKSAIAKYENGRVENIKRTTLLKMSEIFNVSPAYIMDLQDCSNTKEKKFVLSDIEKQIILNYRKADYVDKEIVHRTLGVETSKEKRA